MWTERGN